MIPIARGNTKQLCLPKELVV